jgi:simple sugar transport system substrate-binding protein
MCKIHGPHFFDTRKRRNVMRKKGLLAPVLVLCLFVLATGVAGAQEKKLVFYYVDSGTERYGYPFWPQYYKGIKDAAEMLAPLGVEVKHLFAENSPARMEEMLTQAVAANPDGLVTIMLNPRSYEAILKPLVEKRVPIMAACVDDPRPVGERIPYLAYYGEDLRKSGADLAEAVIAHVKATGGKAPRRALLVSPHADHSGWEERLKRFEERLAAEYGTRCERMNDTAGDMVGPYVAAHPDVDLLCAQESWTWYRYIPQLRMSKKLDKDFTIACFDLSSGILPYVKQGEVVAVHDQQQYLQGFLPLFDLYLYLKKGKLHPISVYTGQIVNQDNVDAVQEGANLGYR